MKYFCAGRVHPERDHVGFSQIKMTAGGGAKAAVSCDASQIIVVLEHPSDDLNVAYNVASGVADIVVEALGFSYGISYSAEIIQVTAEDGISHVFGARTISTESGQTLKVENFQDTFNQAFKLSGPNIFFRWALHDYLRAFNNSKDCPAYCYRAIESIRSAFQGKTENDQWNAMHSALGTNRSTIINTVKNYADPIRHGKHDAPDITHNQRWEMLRPTRDILLEYMKHETKP